MTDITLPAHGTAEHAALVDRVGEQWYENNRDRKEQPWDALIQRNSPYLTFVRGEASSWLAALRQVALAAPREDPAVPIEDDGIVDAEIVE